MRIQFFFTIIFIIFATSLANEELKQKDQSKLNERIISSRKNEMMNLLFSQAAHSSGTKKLLHQIKEKNKQIQQFHEDYNVNLIVNNEDYHENIIQKLNESYDELPPELDIPIDPSTFINTDEELIMKYLTPQGKQVVEALLTETLILLHGPTYPLDTSHHLYNILKQHDIHSKEVQEAVTSRIQQLLLILQTAYSHAKADFERDSSKIDARMFLFRRGSVRETSIMSP